MRKLLPLFHCNEITGTGTNISRTLQLFSFAFDSSMPSDPKQSHLLSRATNKCLGVFVLRSFQIGI